MQKGRTFFSGVKFVYFMLLVCLTLSICVTSCSSDEFETNLPEEQKQYTKAELIEQALSRLPQTRINTSGAAMVTIKDTVVVKGRCLANELMLIMWGNDSITFISSGFDFEYTHIYTDNYPSHMIYISGSELGLQSLNVDNNGLILLEIYSNENLTTLSCVNNYLDKLDLKNCVGVKYLYVTNNEISSLEISYLSSLFHLYAENNRLTALDASNNLELFVLFLKNNRIKHLDLSNNPNLATLDVNNNLIDWLNVSNSPNMITLHVAFNPITDIDLSKNIYLWDIDFEGIPIKIFNNTPICDTSFARYSMLWFLNVASTPFDSLDLSNNPGIYSVDISNSAITKLNISKVKIHSLDAAYSKLTYLICEKKDLTNLHYLRIERTPFEEVRDNILTLASALPLRTKNDPGYLYSYSTFLHYLENIGGINWLINQ